MNNVLSAPNSNTVNGVPSKKIDFNISSFEKFCLKTVKILTVAQGILFIGLGSSMIRKDAFPEGPPMVDVSPNTAGWIAVGSGIVYLGCAAAIKGMEYYIEYLEVNHEIDNMLQEACKSVWEKHEKKDS